MRLVFIIPQALLPLSEPFFPLGFNLYLRLICDAVPLLTLYYCKAVLILIPQGCDTAL